MRIKRELYETLSATPRCTNWAMERHVFDGVVRPDLSGRINDVPLVIEIQRSNTSVETVARRFHEYSNRGIAMLWILTKAPSEGSSTLADWKQYLHLIYQGVLYIHSVGSQVKIMKCDYNSWTIRTYETEIVGTADIAKHFEWFMVNPIKSEKSVFEGGLIWSAKKVGEMLFNEAIEAIKYQRNAIWDAVKNGHIDDCNNLIDSLKNYINTVQLPESQSGKLRDYLRTFDESVDRDRRNVIANAKAKVELEARQKIEREERERLAAIKWEAERPEREARYIKQAEEAAAAHLAAQQAKKFTTEKPLTALEKQEKADRELWRAKKNHRLVQTEQKIVSDASQTPHDVPYDKEAWKVRLAEQNASAEAWAKRLAEQANASDVNNTSNNSH